MFLAQPHDEVKDDPHVDRDDDQPEHIGATHEFIGFERNQSAAGDDREVSCPAAFQEQAGPLDKVEDRVENRRDPQHEEVLLV